MSATTAMVMATAKMTTGEYDNDKGRGRQRQRARMATTRGKDDNNGKDINSKDDCNDSKDDQQGR
jgi:hypothetical protein